MPLTSMVRPNGPRVREIREGMDLTQIQMARKLRRSRMTVWNIEAGKPVSKIVMRQVARSLKVSFCDITMAESAETEQPGEAAA